MGDVLMALRAKRRYRMDGKTFDSLAKLTSTSTGRRRLVQAAAAAGIGSFLTRGGAAADDVVAEACQRRGSSCNRDRQCECFSDGAEFKNVECRLPKKRCFDNEDEKRCCGLEGATCDKDCDCCKRHRCNNGKCVR
jgi:hypothetical protein